MFGHTRDEFGNYQTKVLIEEPPNLLYLGRIFRVIECTKIRRAGLVTCRSKSEWCPKSWSEYHKVIHCLGNHGQNISR